ncbi:MAG TPA: O-antigen ligase family protein [Bryobacteraceae bacterium]|nr:O-antigen ligase family protein [Bryobacteraceae bacterium]
MALLLALALAFIALAIAPGWFFYYDVTPKIVLLLLATAVAAVWWSAAGGATGFFRASRAARWFLLAVCGMAVSLAVSTLASVNPTLSLSGSAWRNWGLLTQLAALAFAYMAAACCAGQPGRLRAVLRFIAASGVVVALYGTAQYFGWDPLLDVRAYHVGEGVWAIVRPPSTLGHADYSADWLLFVVFSSAALVLSETEAAWRLLGWGAVAASSVAIVFTGTRAAMIGLVAGAAFLVIWRGLRITRRWVAGALVIGVAAAVFYVSPAGLKLRARVHWALREPAGGARFLLWRDSLRMAAGRWPAGYGPETFIPTFALHQSVDLSRAYPDFYHESPHNIVLDALVAQGVPGPVLLLVFAGAGFAAACGVRRNPAAGALAAGLTGMTISEQFTCFTMPIALAYYVTIAMLVSLSIPGALPARPVRRRWPGVAAAVCCAGVWAVFGVRLAMAETALARVRRDLEAYRVVAAARDFSGYQRWRWPGDSADLWYSRRLAQIAGSNVDWLTRMQAFQQAGLAAQRATQTSEAAFNAYYNVAAFYARQNDFARTEQSLRSAIARAPNWYKTHWMLAQVLQAAARLPEAEAEAATAVEVGGGKHPEVTGTLERIRSALAASRESQQK